MKNEDLMSPFSTSKTCIIWTFSTKMFRDELRDKQVMIWYLMIMAYCEFMYRNSFSLHEIREGLILCKSSHYIFTEQLLY